MNSDATAWLATTWLATIFIFMNLRLRAFVGYNQTEKGN
jgi:hypothetical protein